MKVIIYARISSKADDSLSVETQLKRMREYALAHGLTIIGEFVDEGRSGKSLNRRPQLQAALAMVGPEVGLLVYRLDRLCRNTQDFLNLMAEHFEGASFRSVCEQIDTSTPAGRMMLTMIAAFAQYEREMTATRVCDWHAEKKAKGERTGRVSLKDVHMPLIQELRQAGFTTREISDSLRKNGFAVSKSTVARMLA